VTGLEFDEDALVACVSCGLCLPHCPTYRATGLEIASPRGRIAAMRVVDAGRAPLDDAFATAMFECVQCRGCEAACPSSVPFGHLMEQARDALHRQRPSPRPRRVLEWIGYHVVLAHHTVLLAATWLLAVAQRLRLVPARYGIPKLRWRSLRRPLDVPRGGAPDAWLFTGCVMDAWFRDTHRATAAVMRAAGARPARPAGGDCCGALHLHAGRHDDAVALARRTIASMPGPAPIVVNSAGCGAVMKEYGSLVGTEAAREFSARVHDFSEWLASRGGMRVRATGRTVVVQDPCHLRHVQKCHLAVRRVLEPAYRIVETDDDGLCCGAGGAYAALQPQLAGRIRERKREALRRAGGPDPVVASANPGCQMHLAAAGFDVRHPAQLLADAMELNTDA
jgi:glycolate oxidase iron-sulfur subunit